MSAVTSGGIGAASESAAAVSGVAAVAGDSDEAAAGDFREERGERTR
jgi:hypothetical protein